MQKTILVADDHAYILKLVEFSLEEINCWIEPPVPARRPSARPPECRSISWLSM